MFSKEVLWHVKRIHSYDASVALDFILITSPANRNIIFKDSDFLFVCQMILKFVKNMINYCVSM